MKFAELDVVGENQPECYCQDIEGCYRDNDLLIPVAKCCEVKNRQNIAKTRLYTQQPQSRAVGQRQKPKSNSLLGLKTKRTNEGPTCGLTDQHGDQ